ncbi:MULTISPECIES: hypothetical protein [Nannocystis]|uniref:Uncharacterized protein n=1 Tax=Nannocystis radixulma TaxID=2995305 RepID=A0ABT5BQN5_9BACT|nr:MULTISPECIES: hypothetical protein [Nannocystis]MCY1055628.1 hypothetical protein [Nannocystis sp. SCPEA4]MDC0675307.1 hypothetical protein [Nannocystis radixulma]
MLVFVDPIAAPAAVLSLAGVVWFRRVAARVPTGPRFLCSPQPSRVSRPEWVVGGMLGVWLLGLGMWLGGRAAGEEMVHFFGMLVLVGVLWVWALARLLARRIASGVLLEVEPGDAPCLVLAGDQPRRVPLAPGSVRAWTVGNGISGPMCLQLASGPDAATGVALFVVPALRQWKLAEGAAWLNAYAGWCPVARGPDLLDLLAPFVVPGDRAWARDP